MMGDAKMIPAQPCECDAAQDVVEFYDQEEECLGVGYVATDAGDFAVMEFYHVKFRCSGCGVRHLQLVGIPVEPLGAQPDFTEPPLDFTDLDSDQLP